jgi:hypothetical protein
LAKLSHTACFAHFGTAPRNVQWSWSARNEATRTVVVTLWQDEFKRVDGKLSYERGPAWIEGSRRRPGHSELMENLRWALDHCDGWVRVIIAIAKNKNAHPRSISECFPSKMQLRVTHLDQTTGAFAFEAPEFEKK